METPSPTNGTIGENLFHVSDFQFIFVVCYKISQKYKTKREYLYHQTHNNIFRTQKLNIQYFIAHFHYLNLYIFIFFAEI